MRVSVAGKGGSGKTTIAGTLARVMARTGRSVVAIDADSNPNLAVALGVEPAAAGELPILPSDLLKSVTDLSGTRELVLTLSPADLLDGYATTAPDGVRLIVASHLEHAGTG